MYGKIEGGSYIQHSIYAESISEEKKLDVEYFFIKDLSGAPVAIVQVLNKRILGLFNIYRVNRGPLFFAGQKIDAPEIAVILTLLKRSLGKKSRGLLYIAPDIQYSEALVDLFSNIGFKYRKNKAAWESAYIDIDLDESQILDRMSGRWRNSLKKALKLNLNIQNLSKYDSITHFINLYECNKVDKGFVGVSTKRVLDFLRASSKSSGISIFIANIKNRDDSPSREEVLGGVAIIHTSGVATYLIGASTEEGRRKDVNTLLLWAAILKAKELGCKKFDLGGLGDSTPSGIAKFKRSLNPRSYKLIGEFWSWI
jgi:lipid II:glycine glycyltransferase (peptidoglycan interpeptide bridge formation enzyme)